MRDSLLGYGILGYDKKFFSSESYTYSAIFVLTLASSVLHNYQLQEATKLATISTSSSGAIGLDT